MLKNIKKEKAITLIALVITIVVILILAGISIAILTGENGIINKANVAKEESKKAEYKEELELIGQELQIEQMTENITDKEYMDKYKEKIKEDVMFKEAKVSNPTTENDTIVIIVITKEGYVYKITKTKVDFIGKQGETAPPDLEESDIEGICNPDGWTNGEVKVTVKVNNKELSKYTIKYSLDGKTNWRTYTGPIAFKDNGSLFVRVENELLEFGGATTVNVANIDRLAPKQFVPTATSTTNSITLTGSTTDAPKTEKDGCSGIKEYYFSNDNGATWKQNSNKLATSYTFTKLQQNKEYKLKMKAVDKAGNEIVTSAITKTTGKVEGLTESNVKFGYTPSTPTKGTVKVKITTDITGYTLRYSKDGKQWTNYTQEVTMTDNGDIYAQLWDGTNAGGYATGNVANIDRLAPKQFVPTATSTTNSITLTGSTTDAPKTEKDGCSGIKEYYFSNDNGATWKQNSNKLATSYTFTKLQQNKEYKLKMKAVDKAGNEIVTSAITKTTGKVEGLTESNVKFGYTPSTPTKGTVKVKITTDITGYTLRYSKDGKQWTNYTQEVTMTDNGDIYAQLWDGTNAGGYATGNVANIDRLAPKQFVPTATSTTNSITLTGSTTDAPKTEKDGCSGIKEYYFSNDNGATWKQNSNKLATSYTFTKLQQNKEYTLKMKAVDKAGNEVVTSAITKTTGKVEGAKGATYSPTTWTNKDVEVTLPTKTGYTTRYVTNGGTPTKDSIEYKGPFKVSGNCVINYCYSDGTNIGGNGTANITIIDKLEPKNATIKLSGTSTNTNSSVTATVTHTDEQADSKNAHSGIKISKCKWVYNTTSTAIGVNESSYTGGTFTSNGEQITLKTTEGTYYLHVLTTDNAGNKKETISEAFKVTSSLSSKVNVGDYVAYKAGTHSYTSEKGTGTAGGNGYDTPQTFTSNDNIKWRVLSKENNEVVLISEEPLQTDDNKDFYLNGAIGYLYAEEELNKICSIYGHGVGANTSKTFSYEVGDVVEGVEKRTLTGSGARSITVEDINKITGYTPNEPTTPYTKSIYYPTRTTATGYSTSAANRTDKGTLYFYRGSEKIDATNNKYKMLFDTTYWLASRCVGSDGTMVNWYYVRSIDSGLVRATIVCDGSIYRFDTQSYSRGVRPVVYLKSDIQASGKDSSGAWKIE